MAHYWPIRKYAEPARTRTLERLLELRCVLEKEVSPIRSDNLLLATWNIRDFDSNKFGHGPRLAESFHYLAEVISRFDLVAVQEINRDIAPLQRLMWYLGPDWSHLVTGVTEGSSGNEERMAFLFNARRVRFTNQAGQVVLPDARLVKKDGKAKGGVQFARAPYMASFQAGWFKFNLCTVHIYYGSDSGEEYKRRVDEINQVAAYFSRLKKKEEDTDYILLGDFNILSPQDETMKALKKNGFRVPEPLQKMTNVRKDRYYDQIAFRQYDKRLELRKAGAFDFRTAVFRDHDDDFDAYFECFPQSMHIHPKGKKKGQPRTRDEMRAYYNKEWITWQISDHMLLWVELKVDFTDDYLNSLKPGNEPLAAPNG